MGQQAFDLRLNVVVLRVRLEGRGRRYAYLRMVLDTGASMTIIPWDAAEALGYDPARTKRRVRFMTGSGMEAAPVLTVKTMEASGVRINRVPVLCHDLPQRSLVDGLLGLSFLKHCR
ncbi:MAG: retropepsin-like domain-containing protein, partial [Candidatus Omnitrophica bacterium]|nr:retropepsin-like domain-containing protein [Candidatus Omnitrophota bacterium]